jgi:hypothetical protein
MTGLQRLDQVRSVTPAPLSGVDARRVAAELARLGGSVAVTTVTVTTQVPAAARPRVATVRPLPRWAPVQPRRRSTAVASVVAASAALTVLGGLGVAGYWLGTMAAGWVVLKALGSLVVLGAVLATVYGLLGRNCPGMHCGGCDR